MNVPRKVFLFTTTLLVAGTVIGIVVLILMEYEARAALPPEQQTAEAIATLYDGAVCLGCDLSAIFVAMLGSAAVVISLLTWGVYEVGRVFLAWQGKPR